jgi:hypothetical protein
MPVLAPELREVLIDLRLIANECVRRCAGCGGSGRLARSRRECPVCRQARRALETSACLLVPTPGELAVDNDV